jgi:phosphoribosyl-AMP cyclohydrolase
LLSDPGHAPGYWHERRGPIMLNAFPLEPFRVVPPIVPIRSKSPVSTPNASSPDFSKGDGLLPAIAQDAVTGEVLMLAYMNAASYAETVSTGRAVYFSRSRHKLWRKGEESGNVQQVQSIFLDCDADTILLKVHQVGGAACHEGYSSCFFRQVTPEGLKVLGQRVFDPKEVYKKP